MKFGPLSAGGDSLPPNEGTRELHEDSGRPRVLLMGLAMLVALWAAVMVVVVGLCASASAGDRRLLA